MSTPRLRDVVAELDAMYDPRWAEDWDAVGTAVGDPEAGVSRILFAVDPVQSVVDEAVSWGADLVVTHHPLLLRAVHGVAAATPKGRIVHELIRAGIGLHTCHTNADTPPGGVSEAMAVALGLEAVRPLRADDGDPLDKWVTFVPQDDAQRVTAALTAAGAGAVGDYDSCTFVSTGTGSFRPLDGADPAIGTVGRLEHVPETRVEMVADRRLRAGVLSALRTAHPYEEPAFDVFELVTTSRERGSGRIGHLAEQQSVRHFAESVVEALPSTYSAARVAGDPDRPVGTVAVCGGAGDFLLDRARSAGADVYVTSDLRHHPVSELVEHDDAPAVVDVPHWAAEWTWLPLAAQRLTEALGEQEATVETRVSRTITDPWTMHVPWPDEDRSNR